MYYLMLKSVDIIIPYNFVCQSRKFNYLRKHKSLPSTFSINFSAAIGWVFTWEHYWNMVLMISDSYHLPDGQK